MAVFELNLTDLLNFKRMQRKMPKIFSRAGGHVLNDAAFGTRELSIRNIKRDMITRNERFVKGSVFAQRSRITAPLAQQYSKVGSIKRKRFGGWKEQEMGQQKSRKYYAKETARKDSRQKQILRLARLRAAGRFPKPADFRGGGGPVAKAARMVHILSRSGFTKPFIILGLEKKQRGRKPPPGVYRLGAGKYPNKRLTLLQRFKKPESTKKKPWMKPAREEYISRVDLRTVWGRAVVREMRRMGARI